MDRRYVPTRYPDAHPSGSAFRHYTRGGVQAALDDAIEVVACCEHRGLEG